MSRDLVRAGRLDLQLPSQLSQPAFDFGRSTRPPGGYNRCRPDEDGSPSHRRLLAPQRLAANLTAGKCHAPPGDLRCWVVSTINGTSRRPVGDTAPPGGRSGGSCTWSQRGGRHRRTHCTRRRREDLAANTAHLAKLLAVPVPGQPEPRLLRQAQGSKRSRGIFLSLTERKAV